MKWPVSTRILVIVTLCFAVVGAARAASGRGLPIQADAKTPPGAQLTAADLEKEIPDLMAQGDVPGLSIAIIRDGRLVSAQGFGVKNVQTKEPVKATTVFEAASLSKPVFTYAVLKLVEAGKLDLDVPLSKYLPGYIQNDQRLNLITARRVLSHTTGFPNWRPFGKPLEILFTPGEKFSYSGEGFVYLQKVVEHITGERLNEVMNKLVFGPLGMTSSSYLWRTEYETTFATGYLTGTREAPKARPTTENAAASLHTTATDYATFVLAIMSGTGLKRETLDQMLTPQVRLNPACVNCTGAEFPAAGPLSPYLAWGLGIGLERTAEGNAFWHWGDNGSFKCFVMAYRKEKFGFVAFTNSEEGLSIMPELATMVLGGDHPAFAWIHYFSYRAPSKLLYKDILKDGIGVALKRYRQSGHHSVDESEMNRLGYIFLNLKKVPEAVEVFRLNVEEHPDSFNVYDSLGEAYMASGQKEQAVACYKKSLELKPSNDNAARMLKKLSGN
ncbi:MAG TPA: serine hydrolase [Blastocatellia bacterium]|nr:serine hydrolase [Blastocatellia bacterium]